jgi:single-strand DNA-binding protein
MFNKVVLVGNLTRDIELRYTQSGTAIANSSIATSRKFTSNGEKKEEVCFIDITFFGRSGEVANQYLRKGSKILVEGRLNFDQWVDNQGAKRSKHSVIVETMQMLDSRAGADNGGNDYSQNSNQPPQHQQNPNMNSNNYNQPPAYNSPQYGDHQPNGGGMQRAPQTNKYSGAQRMPENNIPTIDIDEDEIPF